MADIQQTRLFLSVDISGSTNLKNLKNPVGILERYNDLKMIYKSFISTTKNSDEKSLDDDTPVLEVLKNESEDNDWIKIINNTFTDFNTMFTKELNNEGLFPWKVIGDELVYSIQVKNRSELHEKMLAFYKTLKKYDKNLNEKNLIRLKGSAWVASFPIRNRVIEIPCPTLYTKNSEGEEFTYPYPKEDYLGPEMDIGFRIGKCVASGFIAASIELVYLLGGVESSSQFKVCNVGWEQLKGVWGGRYYPIYWLELPDIDNKKEYEYDEYYLWETETNRFLSKWDKAKKNLNEAKSEKNKLEQIITKLPAKLGVHIPCFPGDKEYEMQYSNILTLFDKLNKTLEKTEDNILNQPTQELNDKNPAEIIDEIISTRNLSEH